MIMKLIKKFAQKEKDLNFYLLLVLGSLYLFLFFLSTKTYGIERMPELKEEVLKIMIETKLPEQDLIYVFLKTYEFKKEIAKN